jgi:hypothetical protein
LQIIAISEAVCLDIGWMYNLLIKLIGSANGKVD